MGLFKKKPGITDRVWMSNDLKRNDILVNIEKVISVGLVPLAIFHFVKSGQDYRRLFETSGYRIYKLQSLSELEAFSAEEWRERTDLVIMDSDIITPSDMRVRGKHEIFAPILLERYPLPEPDEKVIKFIRKRRDMKELVSYVSLDEPWLKELSGDRLINLFEQLGVDPEEMLQHKLISSSLKRVQKRLGEKVRRDFPQDSLEAWLKINTSD